MSQIPPQQLDPARGAEVERKVAVGDELPGDRPPEPRRATAGPQGKSAPTAATRGKSAAGQQARAPRTSRERKKARRDFRREQKLARKKAAVLAGEDGNPARQAPPWLVSALVHLVGLVVLGLFVIAVERDNELVLDVSYHERLGDSLEPTTLDSVDDELLQDEAVITPDEQLPVEDPLAMPELLELSADPTHLSAESIDAPLGRALTGREAGMKEALLAAYGGDATTEAAVQDALRWLARNQRRSGLWNLTGPYQGGGTADNDLAATAMALLAFQGAGYTPSAGGNDAYSKLVERGWNALLRRQDKEGAFLDGTYHHRLYTHAQCTIALCELYGMTRNDKYREPAQRAIQYCVDAQSSLGGWRYDFANDADLSVTGWFVMALKSAQMSGIEVPSETLMNINDFLERVERDGGSQYAYRSRDKPRYSMTAEGLLCRQYLGWSRYDERLQRGVEYLLSRPMSWESRNIYAWYYATQVMHHMEGEAWRDWNEQMKAILPAQQVQQGREKGSWEPSADVHDVAAGRLYVTCLCTYMLEVYYRHLPLYRQELVGSQ